MLLEPIKITLYDPETQEIKSEYKRNVITFGMLLSAVQLQEALAKLPAKKRRWWWQSYISEETEQINALLELVVQFFGCQFTVKELREGADVSEVMTIIRAIIGRGGKIVQANPTKPPPPKKHR